MKQRKLLIFLLVFFLTNIVYASRMKSVDVGKLQARVWDDGIQNPSNADMCHAYYPRGVYNLTYDWLGSTNTWPGGYIRQAGTLVGHRNWTDTLGNFWPFHVTGHCAHELNLDENVYQFNVPDEGGYSIRRFLRFPPTEIIVDNQHCERPWGSLGDQVNPSRIWGSADMMVEMHYRLSNGMDVCQRNLAWSQPLLDDGVIWDLTFVNTGNTDGDSLIELPGQTLDSVVILKHFQSMPNAGLYPFGSWAGVTEDDNTRLSYPQDHDSLRISYVALARKAGHTHDSYGDKCEVDWGGNRSLEDGCGWTGHAILFAPKNTQVPQSHPIADVAASNDPAQPSMYSTIEGGVGVSDIRNLEDTADHRQPYKRMRMGIHGYDDTNVAECQNVYDMRNLYDVYDTTAMGAPTYYDQPQDRMGELNINRGQIFPRSWSYYPFSVENKFSIGPYNMEFGDTLRFVYAVVAGAVHRKTTYIISQMRENGNARNYEWLAGMDSATIRQEYQRRDPVAELYGDQVFMNGGLNEIATDYVISTGKDSLFTNGMAFQRAFNMNYNVPASPNPPSRFEVSSRPEMIDIAWSYEPGYEPSPSELAGFKIYRAYGGTEYVLSAGTVTGDWQVVDSVGPGVRSFADTMGVVRGFDYYYCITAVGTNGRESGMWLTMTRTPFAARLTDYPVFKISPTGDTIPSLDSVVVVPNPLNINSAVQSGGKFGEDENKITFRKLPGECTIRIFTESGELIKTIEHDDGSGTALWQTNETGGWYTTTVNNQRPASGIYIAHIQDSEGNWVTRKFIIIR
jgi:hypothetical protein